MNNKLHKVIGIDLGTTYSAVSAYNVFKEGAEIINNSESEGNPESTPSVVSLDQMLRKVIVGSAAKRNLAVCPDNTVIEIKREMGELFLDEKALEKFRAKGVFNIKDPVKTYFAGQWMLPQEISAFILMKMKEVAEKEIGEEIHDAVITVPAYFKEPQKKATEEAALLAGLYPRQIIPEPTAAAICFGVDRVEAEKKTYLVYDLGGGTFDVSIIQVETGILVVVATSGDPRLGGGDFDDEITNWAINELKNKEIEILPDMKSKLKARAEIAKIALSFNETTEMVLEFVAPGMKLTLSRTVFLSLIEGLLQKSLNYVDEALNMAKKQQGVDREQIDAILLVGGSSKIPRVKEMLLDYFHKEDSFVRNEVNPDTVVARGAAILAYKYAPTEGAFDIKYKKDSLKLNTDPTDIPITQLRTEHSLGIGVQGNICDIIIAQGTGIPCDVKKGPYYNPPMSTKIGVPVFQGEGKFTYENTPIGELLIEGIEPKPEGFHQFEVTFKLDINGLLTMVVMHLNTNKPHEMRFDQKTGIQGGEDAMAAMHNKLLKMYASASAQQIPGDTRTTTTAQTTPPPPPTPTPIPSQEPTTQQINPVDAQANDVIQAPVDTQSVPTPPAPASAATSIIETPEVKVDIPEQFKQLVRRTQKKLLKTPNEVLQGALDSFIAALSAGISGDKLEEIGDTLADAFDDARD